LPFVDSNGVRIHFVVEGKGNPLVLVDGIGMSLQVHYSTGLVEALRDRYRLVLIDTRGHGKSDKPHDPESYRMALRVGDVTAVLDALGIRKAHYLGYSMGGWIGFGIAKYAPERLTSLIIGGMDADDPDPSHPSEYGEQRIRTLREGREEWETRLRRLVQEEARTAQRPKLVETFLSMALQSEFDPEAQIALTIWGQKEVLGFTEVLRHLTIPCLLIVGEADESFKGARAASQIIPHSRFVSFPGLGHIETGMRLDLLMPPVLAFLSEADAPPTSPRQ